MKVLLVGGGAREHAIASALKKNPNVTLYTVMKNTNPGILRLSEEISIHDEMDTSSTVDFALKSGVDFAFVGPESPLAAGTADSLSEVQIPCIGPVKDLARIESDKEFMRNLMEKYEIPSRLGFAVFDNMTEARDYIDEIDYGFAVKPVGLTGGKGVKVLGDQLTNLEEAKKYVKEVIDESIGGGRVLIEEKAYGEEFTLQAFVDGKNIALMPCVQDHKRAFDGDKGHNTGGMGSYSRDDSLLPFIDSLTVERAGEVIKRTVKALRNETGREYKGILYGQFMVGRDQLKLIEFNCRFGDPEAMNVLSILSSDLASICENIIDGRLNGVGFDNKATVCKYIVPEGYGLRSTKEQKLSIDEKKISSIGASLYFAAVNERDGEVYTTSSRSIGIVGVEDSIDEAEKICEEAIGHVKGRKLYHRRDIGTKELIDRKLERLKVLE